MTMIDRVGTFRGIPTQAVIQKSSGGFPQLVVRLQITEMFNKETQEWVGWSEYDHTITAYLVLFNETKALLNYENVMRAFNWDGVDLAALQQDDFGDLQVSFTVEENEWQGVISLRVNWVDAYDAEPRGGPLTPMATGDIKALAAQYQQFMKAAPKATPVKKGRGKAKAKAKVAPVSTPPTRAPSTAVEMTEDAAWTTLNKNAVAQGVNVETDLADTWLNTIDEMAVEIGVPQDDFTTANWGTLFVNVSEKLNIAV